MDARRAAILDTIGVERFRSRAPAAPAAPPAAALPGDDATLGWDELAARVEGCARCGLEATRTNTVFGVGDRAARWMIVGEAPGAE